MNIVFDLGGVVFCWKPRQVFAKLFPGDDKIQELYHENLMGHPDWHLFDQGTIDTDYAVKRAASRIGTTDDDVRSVLTHLYSSLEPIPETISLIKRVEKHDHRLFCLSNMPAPTIEYLEDRYDFLELFDHSVISSRVKMAKPDEEIFRHLLDHYDLTPEETVFIDDSEKNIAAAKAFGINTIHFSDASDCEEKLAAVGVRIKTKSGERGLYT